MCVAERTTKRDLHMKRVQGLVAVCGLSLALTAAMAVPPVVEKLPENAMISVIIPSPQTMQKNLSALSTAVESPMPVMSVDDLLAMSGMGGGIDSSKSMAIVLYGPKDKPADAKADAKPDAKPGAKADDTKKDAAKGEKDAKDAKADAKKDADADDDDDMSEMEKDLERMVILIPVTKYEDFLGNFGAKPAGEGKVDTFASPSGEDAYSKLLGDGYAVMGSDKELVEKFTGKSDAAKSLKARMGKAGEELTDSLDVMAIVNMDRLRPLAEKGMKEMEKQAKERLESAGQESQEKNLAVARWVGEMVVRDTQVIVTGFKFGSTGVTMEATGSFKPDSYLAKTFAGKGNAAPLMSKLPGGNFLWAGAMDLSSPGIRAMMKDLIGKAQLPGGDKAAQAAASAMETTEGIGATIGFPVGGAFAGLLTNTVVYTASKDPAASLKSFKDNLVAMNDQKVETLTYKTKFIENASKAGETPIHAWETKFEAADGGEMPAEMSQAMPFLFGPQGMPVGYVAVGSGGVYSTYAKNTELMTKALDAAKGDNLSADAMLKQSQGMLPKDRIGEMYVGTKGILDLALPFAAMAGMTVPADKIPEKLPPIAGALSSQDGSLRFTMMVPAPVIKTGVFLGTEAQKSMQGGGGEEPAKAKPDQGAGQPKF
jgi:hypothetical protein